MERLASRTSAIAQQSALDFQGLFDTYLRPEDEKAKVVAENEDISPSNLNSRITFTAPKDGAYRIVATSYQQRGAGAYTITVCEYTAKN